MPSSASTLRNPAPAPGEELSAALALVNTRLHGPDGPLDLLTTSADARAWLVDRGLAADEIAIGSAHLASLAQLRDSIRTLIAARITGDLGHGPSAQNADKPFPNTETAAAIGTVNAALAAAPCVTSLAWYCDGPRVTQQRQSRDPFAKVLAAVAADAAELLAGPHADRLAQCAAHNCIRMFIRMHAARHVCSTRCGDRIRAARHYARKRERAHEG